MKTPVHFNHRKTAGLLGGLAAFVLGGCAMDEPFELVDRLSGPPPESVWNDEGLWYRVAGEPPSYLPVGYSAEAPRNDPAGYWVVDKRDGKRFFIPGEGADGYSREVLHAEASEILKWH